MSIVYSMIFDIRCNKDSGLGIKNHIPREARRRLIRTHLNCLHLSAGRRIRAGRRLSGLGGLRGLRQEEQPRTPCLSLDSSLRPKKALNTLLIQFPRGPIRRLSILRSRLIRNRRLEEGEQPLTAAAKQPRTRD